MIHLNNAPILLEFLSHNLKNVSKKTIVNNFYLVSKCNCNQSDCSTVTLKKRKNSFINEDNLEIEIQNSKGFVHFNWLDDEFLEIEAIYYKFPFKYEINKLFPKNGKSCKTNPRKSSLKKIKKIDNIKLNQFLNNKLSIYEKRFFHKSDYRATDNITLFSHLR